jgi:beta-lactamase regulating signal transducer with metallopeptidase domain
MITQAVGALFNACWQGLAIVGLTSLALRVFTRSSAAARYAVWFAALVIVAALPAIDFGLARASLIQPVTAAAAPAAHYNVVQTETVTYAHANSHAMAGRASAVKVPTTTIGYAVEAAPDRVAQALALVSLVAGRVGSLLSSVAIPILVAWLFFSVVMLSRLTLAYLRLRRVKRGLVPLDNASVSLLVASSARPVVVGVVEDLTMPCVLGFAKPAIALPARLASELTRDDLERIVRHEHAHVRRWDDVANALQLIVQAVMCLNPAVHLIARNLNVEREIACDDFAVEPLSERVQYAKCLTQIAVNGFGPSSALPAPGFFFNRKQLLVRVERLLERGHNGSTTIGTAARYALVGLALVALAVARVQLPVIAASAHSASNPASDSSSLHGDQSIDVGDQSAHVGDQSAHVMPVESAGHSKLHSSAHPIAHAFGDAAAVLNVKVHPTIKFVEHMNLQLRTKVTQIAMRHTESSMAAMAGQFSSSTTGTATAPSAQPAPVAPPAHTAPAAHIAPTVPASQFAPVAPVAAASHLSSSGGDFLDALASAGYKNLSVDDLVRLKNVGVDGALIDAAVRYTGSRPSVETLVRMASVGVDAEYLSHLQASGYPRMALEDVIRMRAVGVDPSYIHDMTAVLHTRPSIEQLTQLRALGVDAGYVRSFAQLGYDKLSPNDLMRLRAVGVDADYVRMLRSKGIGGSGLSVDDLIRMKSVGLE